MYLIRKGASANTVLFILYFHSLNEWLKRVFFFCFTGFSFFAIGVADADYSELVNIGSKPSERHVFFVDDFDAFAKIEDELITFVCETASAS